MEDLLNKLLERLSKNSVKYDTEKISLAFHTACMAHEGQKRESGEDYISHPVAVAMILADFEPDTASIIAALLHDVLEDTNITYRTIKKDFGAEVADLVEGVTKLGKIPYSSKEEQQIENLRKMFLAMAKDIRVILIKLADRLHNMRTIQSLPDEKRREKSLETMEVFAPLAHRLGMRKVKLELEDISLKYLDPVGYDTVKEKLSIKLNERMAILHNIERRIAKRIDENKIEYRIEGRIKHIYSIYRKMFSLNKNFDEIYDLYAVRIIVGNVTECYNVLGIVHDLFKPIPGRFKDYISTPKPNMYQSLHTTVIGKEGISFEVQIRTWEMHRIAEYGIAAHWKYKRGIFGRDSLDEKLSWVRQLLELQKDTKEPEDFMRTLKIDLFADEVFVFTPNGDVINLPAGATIIDFAYAIHSAVGNRMIGAKVNGKIEELTYNIQNGEIIEILTGAASKGPSRDWLKIAKTSEARNKIRQWFKKEKREENIINGKEDLERELKRNGVILSDSNREEILASALKRAGLKDLDELYAAIGYGGISITKILPKIKDDYHRLTKNSSEQEEEQPAPKKVRAVKGISVEGIDNCLIKIAQCCSPLPGDDIIGFVTRGYGVSVHKKICRNITNLGEAQLQRLINVHWNVEDDDSFFAALNIVAVNRLGLAADVTTQLAAMRVMIHGLNAKESKDGTAVISVTISIKTLEHLQSVIQRLMKIKGVIDITRGNS